MISNQIIDPSVDYFTSGNYKVTHSRKVKVISQNYIKFSAQNASVINHISKCVICQGLLVAQ